METNLNNEQILAEIEKLAKLGLDYDEIETVISPPKDECNPFLFHKNIRDKKTPEGIAFLKGKYTLKIELLTSLKQLALNGSTPALEKMIKQLEIQNTCE